MIHNSPKLLCNILLYFCLIFSGTVLNAQMDLETANVMIAYEADESKNLADPANDEFILFKEIGKGQLINGRAEIKIDPKIAQQIEGKRINDLVTIAIQMEGKSNGVYVSKKNKQTFILTELESGASNARFSYKVIVQSPSYSNVN